MEAYKLFNKLFSPKDHRPHRMIGLSYLIQFAMACHLYATDFERFQNSWLTVTVPITGLIQAISASLTFTFMPRNAAPGYVAMSDKAPLSYHFIVENTFFAMLLAFQVLFFSRRTSDYLPSVVIWWYTFFPYYKRKLWPKTSMRDSFKEHHKNSSSQNLYFNYISSWAVKIFYNFAKHYIGFFLNYLRLLNRIDSTYQWWVIWGVLLVGSYQTTVSMFLHTLAFKKYISHRVGSLLYTLSYSITIYYYWLYLPFIRMNADLFWLTFLGLVINFINLRAWHVYQFAMFVLLVGFPDLLSQNYVQ